MSQELQKLNQINAVTFHKSANDLTNGQKVIMDMLTWHMNEKLPVTKKHIVDAFVKTKYPNGKMSRAKYEWRDNGYYFTGTEEIDVYDNWMLTYNAMEWFKRNIGSCIVKGKIVAIPLIEIED